MNVTQYPTTTAPGSVTRSPALPAAFAETFTSRIVEANGLRQHVVVGGDGPAVLLVHGWPESWYAWRNLMPTLAQDFTVISVDQRGMGLTEKPEDGYDAGTLGQDLAALMTELGHERFAVVAHDTGTVIGYALAADNPERVDRLVVAEIPGAPGTSPAPPLFVPAPLNNKLWHIPFNRAGAIAEQLIVGREDIFFGYEFEIQGGPALDPDVIAYYVANFTTPESLRGGLGFYRAWDAHLAQNAERVSTKLSIPVLGIGGAQSWGDHVGGGWGAVADNVETAVIPGAGHWVAEQAPEEMLAVLTAFLAPYRAPVLATT